MKVEGARVVVVGMARSGVAAVELLIEKGARVIAVDQKPVTNDRMRALGITLGPQTPESFSGADLIVLSPGVPADLAMLTAARNRSVPVIGDLELASWFLEGDIAGITGSNGKTTTTALTGHILQNAGIAAQVGGNIGTPPASMVKTSRPGQWNVLELSSFQLETTQSFRARVGAVLNVTADHLDRHYTMDNYARAKARIFANQRAGDVRILNADDPITRTFDGCGPGRTLWFSSTRRVDCGAWLERADGSARIFLHDEPLMDAGEVPLRGLHNIENTMAAALIASHAGASPEQIRAAVKTFPGVEHRIEFVRDVGGVAYYNDSKATNVDATMKALEAFDGGLWVILGGKDKNSDYSPLGPLLASKARGVLLIGAAAAKMEDQLRGTVLATRCETLERAVAEAHRRAGRGETVLLAPACASFDQFENFEHRGREFKRLVHELRGS